MSRTDRHSSALIQRYTLWRKNRRDAHPTKAEKYKNMEHLRWRKNKPCIQSKHIYYYCLIDSSSVV